tara:strand:+ start:1288 stop:2040 length:753 start_codon:yes stop_codon:yes gene_type:complete
MSDNWINIEGELISLNSTPDLLRDLDLIPIFLRRYLERKYTNNIKVTKEEQIEFQKKFLIRENIKDKDNLKNWLSMKGVSESEMNKNLYKSLLIEKFKNENFGSKIESLFLKRKTLLDRFTYSLIRVKTRNKAAELFLRLQEEESTFQELASSFSEGVEQVLNGLIGPMELGKINPVIANKLLNSSPGQLWPPFEIEGWWVIIRLERSISSTLNEQMKNRLLDEMYEEWIFLKITKLLNDLKGSSNKNSD